MLVRSITVDKATELIREWNGQTPSGKQMEAEKDFRYLCDRYVLVEVEGPQELLRLGTMKNYLTGGHGFCVYVRYPNDAMEAIRAGRAVMPDFLRQSERSYSSAYYRGSLKILLGLLVEQVDKNFSLDLFAEIIEGQRKQQAAKAAKAAKQEPLRQTPVHQVPQAPAYQAEPQTPTYQAPQYTQPAYQAPQYQEPQYTQPAYQPTPQYAQPAYQAPQYQEPQYTQPTYQPQQYTQPTAQPSGRRRSNVVRFHFRDEDVS